MKITLEQAKAMKFKRHDEHYNRLMSQETETVVTYPEIEVDYSEIKVINKMVYIKATLLETGTPAFMVIE